MRCHEGVDELDVKPAWRGPGIATAVLHTLAGADGGAVKGLQLEVVPADERALARYRRQGLRPQANRHLVKAIEPTRPA